MSSSYLWEDHREDIIGLYEEGLSIPVIHKRIRNDVFKISERVLYDKLRQWNLPTEPAARRERAAQVKAMRKQEQVSPSGSRTLRSNDVMLSEEEGLLNGQYMECSSIPNTSCHSGNLEPQSYRGSEDYFPHINFDFNPTFAVQQAGSCMAPKMPISNNTSFSSNFEVDDSQRPWSESKQCHAGWSTDNFPQELGLVRPAGSLRELRRHSSTTSSQPISRERRARTAGISGVKALAASYNHGSLDPRFSLASTDSGYAGSSRSSLCVHNPQRSSQIETFDHEFASLWKVVCTVRHESAPIYDLMPPCEQCGFGPLHGLAWCANNFSVEEFKRRIEPFRKSRNIRDKAGNTALHYGAKADFDHLFALIEFGVDCSQKNTRGQVFLHLIEPTMLDFDLFNLFNIPGVRNLRGCRDHLGQTVLHELCRKAETKEKSILRYFESEGFSSDILDCFGRLQDIELSSFKDLFELIAPFHNTSECVVITLYVAESPCYQDSGFDVISGTSFLGGNADLVSEPLSKTATFESNQRRIEQDLDVVDQAESNPHYRHAETNSNIIHVLSRLQLDENDRFNRLLKFICLGASLSDYNRDGDLPLISFACQRPDDEHKVTTELYIESLLDALKDRGPTEVHMRNRRGETALHCACVDGSHFSVKLLIARGSNVNSLTFRNESILRATLKARDMESNNQVKLDNFKEVIALLTRSGAVEYPTSLQERGLQSVVDQMANLSMN